jgi:hypothetical protein
MLEMRFKEVNSSSHQTSGPVGAAVRLRHLGVGYVHTGSLDGCVYRISMIDSAREAWPATAPVNREAVSIMRVMTHEVLHRLTSKAKLRCRAPSFPRNGGYIHVPLATHPQRLR